MLQKITATARDSVSSGMWVLKLYWRFSPTYTTLSILTNIVRELINIASSFVFARGIDILIGVASDTTSINYVYLVVAIFFGMSILRAANNLTMSYSQRLLSTMFYPRYQQQMYEKLSRMRIGDLEEPDTNNLIERSRRDSSRVERMFYELLNFVAVMTAVISSGAILLNFAPYFIPIFIISMIPSMYVDRKYLTKLWNFNRDITEDRRKAFDASYQLQDSRKLHELKVTGGSNYLSNRFERFIDNWVEDYRKIRKSWSQFLFSFRIVRGFVEGYADLVIFFRFIGGSISIGDVSFFMTQTSNFMSNMNSLANSINNIYESSLTIKEIQTLFEMPETEDGSIKLERLSKGPDIEFDDVTFTYPGSKKPVIQNLNLSIKSGEKIAVVGHNGAGKTTLIKLLLRFYNLDSGKIEINGNNLADLKLDDYYKNVSTLFQNYNTYGFLNVQENIKIGKAHKKLSMKKLKAAAKMADVDDFVNEYEKGYKQLLSEKYKGGIRPSTGQWQKIAIARFFYRNSPLIIFDEPTAAIDAVAEAKIFNKIYKFFKKKTVIIISHRFSTVRNADRIIVFEKGRIVEQGKHSELIKKNGVYAKAFNLQAEGYK